VFCVQYTKCSLQGVAVCSSFQRLENSNSSVWKLVFKAQSKLDSHSTDFFCKTDNSQMQTECSATQKKPIRKKIKPARSVMRLAYFWRGTAAVEWEM
jgi:hypothetical protein